MGFLCFSIFFVSLFFQGKSEKIRCYCNLKECIADNYSCSFEDGGCFSDFLDYRDIREATHGCLNLLERERQEMCGNAPGSTGAPRSLLLCCQADMCNHLLSPDSLLTKTIIGSLINATEGQNPHGNVHDGNPSGNPGYHSNEVWFKAATIAVPICGAMILLMLVALAFKILRADHVNVEKYGGDASSNANSHIISFKSNELDLSKKIPLLYETRQNEIRNSEDFRNLTSARIHYGQNVNRLKESGEAEREPGKSEKNLENAKINLERCEHVEIVVPTTSSDGRDSEEANNNSISLEETNSTLDVRVADEEIKSLPTLNLNLEKNECLNSCNIYNSPRTSGQNSAESSGALDKLYDKYLL